MEQEETIKSKVKSLIIDANTSGKNVLSTVQQVAEEITPISITNILWTLKRKKFWTLLRV